MRDTTPTTTTLRRRTLIEWLRRQPAPMLTTYGDLGKHLDFYVRVTIR